MAYKQRLCSLGILMIFLMSQLMAASANAPDTSLNDSIGLPTDTADQIDGALVFLASDPERMYEYDITRAPEGYINVIAQVEDLNAGHTEYAENLGGRVTDSWERFDALAITIPLPALPALTYLPGLVWLEPHLLYFPLLDESVPAIRADMVWSEFGLRGENTTIAIVDTGIDAQHESLDDLDDDPGTDDPKVIGFYDARSGQRGEKEPLDAHGHGSHCSGIAAGTGGPDGTYVGVAPQAYLVGVLVGDGSGIAMADLLDGIDWVIANKDRFSIDVMSMSLGGVFVIPGATNDGSSAASQAADVAVEAGIVTTIAVGNGNLQVAAHAGSVSAPADSFRAITVGSVNNNGVRAISSSRGPTGDGRIKPDVMAPGVGIMSVDRNTGNGYTSMSGTSMACPHVAGLAALMLQGNPSLSPDDVVGPIKQYMHETSRHEWGDQPDPPEPYSPNNQYGWGTVDSLGAAARVLDLRTGDIGSADGDAVIQALDQERYVINFTYTKTEFTYQGENGDSHNPPTGSDAPDTVYIEARLPAAWPEPTNATGNAFPGPGLTATIDPDPLVVTEEDGEWVIGATFSYSGDVSEGETILSFPTLEFLIHAPANSTMGLLRGNFTLNNVTGDTKEEMITVIADPPDLVVTIDADDVRPTEGDLVNFTAEVKNIGQGISLTGKLRLMKNPKDRAGGELLREWTLASLRPDEVLTEVFQWNTTDQGGEYDIVASLEQVIPKEEEEDEENNYDLLSIRVKEKEPDPEENFPPGLKIEHPSDGARLAGVVTIEGTAFDADAEDVLETEVRFLSGNWMKAQGSDTWSFEWDTTDVANGDYTIQARAFDGKDYSGIQEITVTVENEGENAKPTANLDASSLEVLVDETVDLDGSGSGDDGEVVSYLFDFGDGEDSGWQSSSSASHSYASAGEYTATLTVEDDQGERSTNTAELMITVTEPQGEEENLAPTAVITYPGEGLVFSQGDQIMLIGRDSHDPDGDELNFTWHTDIQGILGYGETVQTDFLPGEHVLSLRVEDGNGGEHTTSVRITVLPAKGDGDGGDGGSGDKEWYEEQEYQGGIAILIIGIVMVVALIIGTRRGSGYDEEWEDEEDWGAEGSWDEKEPWDDKDAWDE